MTKQESEQRRETRLPGLDVRLTNAEFDLSRRLLREAQLPTECLCARHAGLTTLMTGHPDREAIARIEATPCTFDEILLNEHYLLAGLRSRDLNRRWETFDQPEHAETIRLYAENLAELVANGDGVTLIGRMGTGKTSAATYIARLGVHLWGGRAVTVTPFGNAISAYNVPRLAERLETSRLLVIDEVMIGRSDKQKELFDDRMSDIAVARYQAQRATLVTANYSEDELTSAYPRMMSRLAETNTVLAYTRTDFRASNRRNIADSIAVLSHGANRREVHRLSADPSTA